MFVFALVTTGVPEWGGATAVLPMNVTLMPSATEIDAGERLILRVRIQDLDGNPTYVSVSMGVGSVWTRYMICTALWPAWDETLTFTRDYPQPGTYTVRVDVTSDTCYPVLREKVTKTLEIHVRPETEARSG